MSVSEDEELKHTTRTTPLNLHTLAMVKRPKSRQLLHKKVNSSLSTKDNLSSAQLHSSRLVEPPIERHLFKFLEAHPVVKRD